MKKLTHVSRLIAAPSRGLVITAFFASIALMALDAQSAHAAAGIFDVKASGSDGVNVPDNVFDAKQTTQWSCASTIGCWLRADLGTERQISHFDIAWADGAGRKTRFEIHVASGGGTYRRVYSGSSSGTTSAYERYYFASNQARYVLLKTFGSSSSSLWSHVSEIRALNLQEPKIIFPVKLSLSSSSLKASGYESSSYAPSRVLDNDPATRWWCTRTGCWIQGKLAGDRLVSAVDVAWYEGARRQSRFQILTSRDGINFKIAYVGMSSGRSLAFERYVFKETLARFVRVVVNGNTLNAAAAITELQVYGKSPEVAPAPVPIPTVTPGPSPTPIPVAVIPTAVKVSASDSPNISTMAVDSNLSTRWSCNGKGCWIRADLGINHDVVGVEVAWHRGALRKAYFNVAVSSDGVSYSTVYTGTSSGSTAGHERYDFSKKRARYVRITGNGTTEGTWNGISELRLITMDERVEVPWLDWRNQGDTFTGLYWGLQQPLKFPNSEILIAAPHGEFDGGTHEITDPLCRALASECMITRAFQESGVRLNVNRPTEGARLACENEQWTPNGTLVYDIYRNELQRRIDRNDLRLLVEIHGSHESLDYGTTGMLQIATKGLTLEEAQYVKMVFEAVRIEVDGAENLEVMVEGVDKLDLTAGCSKQIGSLGVAPKAIHIELSQHLRDPERWSETVHYLTRAIQAASIGL